MVKGEKYIVIFDGVCNLCNASVRFIVKRDRHRIFLFTPQQSETGKRLMEKAGLDPGKIESIVLLEVNCVYLRSTAALRISSRLRRCWPLSGIFFIVPTCIRDAIYRYIASSRYRWFGRREQCMVPDANLSRVFLQS
jgi:predicted DCC family thiol-disulfide oxidoreductase YuxK